MSSLTTKATKRSELEDMSQDISAVIVDGVFKVHRTLGPGLLESTYEKCLEHELTKRGLQVETQKALPVFYDGIKIDIGYRVDMMVNHSFILELKAVEKIIPLYQAQLMTYLRLANMKTGLLINFNSKLIKDGIRRISV